MEIGDRLCFEVETPDCCFPVFFFLPGLSDPNSRQRSSGTARLARGPPVSTYLGDRAAGFEEEGCCESSLAINTFG